MRPLLFLLCINDFENCLKNTTLNIYADDAHVTIASENFSDLMSNSKNELENILDWIRINKLSLNASYSVLLVVGHKMRSNRVGNKLPNIVLNNELMKEVEKIK